MALSVVKRIVLLITAALALLCTCLGTAATVSTVAPWLTEVTGNPRAGIPYSVCFTVCGISFAVFLAICTWFCLTHGGQSQAVFLLRSLIAMIILSMVAAVACSVWFTIEVNDFGYPGILGVLTALSIGTLMVAALRRAKASIETPA